MPNKSLLVALGFALSLLAPSAFAMCDLAMTVTCASGKCTSVTTNNAHATCSGDFASYFAAASHGVTMSGLTTSLGLSDCFTSDDIGVPSGAPFAVCFGPASLGPGGSFTAEVSVGAAS